MSLPSINFLNLTVSEIQPGHTFSPRRPPTRPPIRTPWVKTIPQQPPTLHSFRDIAWTNFLSSRSLWQDYGKNHIMTMHTYIPQPMSLPSINFLHLTISKIWPGQDFIGQGHYGKVKGQIKVTP